LLVAGKEQAVALVYLATFVALIVAGALTVPELGAMGAAVATLIAFGGSKVAQALLYRRAGLPLGDRRHLGAAAAIAAWIALVLLSQGGLRLIVLLAGGATSLALAAIILRRTRMFAPRKEA
jgi:O-antigen/teichoic acid export membrane protein